MLQNLARSRLAYCFSPLAVAAEVVQSPQSSRSPAQPPAVVTPAPEPEPPVVMPEPPADDRPTLTDVQTTDPAAIIMAASGAATALPVFGSVTQSESFGSIADISVEAASTTFGRTGLGRNDQARRWKRTHVWYG